MRPDSGQFDFGRPEFDGDAFEAELDPILQELANPVLAPDQTGSIMLRLGYVKPSARARRRRWLHRAVTRTSLGVIAALAIGVTLHVYEGSDRARKPDGTTIPDAVQTEVERINGTFRRIRDLAPPQPRLRRPAPTPSPREPEAGTELDRSAVGPLRLI